MNRLDIDNMSILLTWYMLKYAKGGGNMRYSVLIVAAGKQSAKGLTYAKAHASFNDSKSVLNQSISVFMDDEQCQQIVIVTSAADMSHVVRASDSGKIVYVKGGVTRQESVLIGLTAVAEDLVLIHDGVRPWVKQFLIDRLLQGVQGEKACVLAHKPSSSVRRVVDGFLVQELVKHDVMELQTPQAYDTSFIIDCYKKAISQGVNCVDDADVVSSVSTQRIKYVEGDVRNVRFILKES